MMNDDLDKPLSELAGEDLLPEGLYAVRINKTEFRESRESKKPMLGVDYIVTDGDEFLGRHIFENLMLEAGQRWKLKQLLQACGISLDSGMTVREAIEELAGKELVVSVIVAPPGKGYEDRGPQNRIKSYQTAF
jgi:hypothetical protein